jgi:hypothetical protein
LVRNHNSEIYSLYSWGYLLQFLKQRKKIANLPAKGEAGMGIWSSSFYGSPNSAAPTKSAPCLSSDFRATDTFSLPPVFYVDHHCV